MLYHLEGRVTELGPDYAVIDCNGIGFAVSVTPNTVSALAIGETGKLYVIEAIGEDHFDLFGFQSLAEKRWFRLLTSVSGVGPKAGMSILSYNSADTLAMAVLNNDEKAFTGCPGIGKKIAQRIILELRDKIAKNMPVSNMSAALTGKNIVSGKIGSAYDEAVSALNVLGYSTADIAPVLKQISIEGKNTQEIIREVLKFMV